MSEAPPCTRPARCTKMSHWGLSRMQRVPEGDRGERAHRLRPLVQTLLGERILLGLPHRRNGSSLVAFHQSFLGGTLKNNDAGIQHVSESH